MRMLAVMFAITAAPTSTLAAEADLSPEALFDVVVDAQTPLDMPVERVAGRALVKLNGVDPRDLAITSPRTDKAQKALLAIEERSGVMVELVRPSLLGWGLYEVRDPAAPKQRPTEAQTLALIERLADDVDVSGASDDRWYRTQALPNDPAFEDMWHLDAIGAAAAWDFTTGTSSQRIGVVDTGTLRDHVELSAKAIAGYDFISSGTAAGDGDGRDADFNDEGDGADCGFGYQGDSWHGSHVAGTILASADNGAGIAGLNWGASLVTARAMGKCGGAISDIMEGAAWMAGAAIDGVPNVGADKVSVMNLSLGGDGGCSNYEQDVIDFITGQGVVFVAAAGNNGGSVGSPANCTNVVSVAAHGPGATKPLAPYSSFGSTIEVVAPGGYINGSAEEGVLSLSGPGSTDYTWQQGTSMAAPHVTGAISLLQVFDATLTRSDLAQLFGDNGDSCAGCNGVPALRIDLLLEAVGATAQPPVDEPPAEEPPPADPVADDTLEPNGAWEERTPIACGVDLSLFMAEGDSDWFSLNAPADADVQVQILAGVDLDLFLTVGPNDADVLDASTSESGEELVGLVAPGNELGIAVLPWMEATGSYRLVVSCGSAEPDPTDPGGDPVEPPSEDPSDGSDDITDPADPTSPDDAESAAPPADEQEGTMTRAEQLNGGLRGGCSQASGSATPLALLFLGVAAITRRPSRRRRR